MIKLTTEQMIYLLYASSYLESDTITKGTVKKYLPIEWKDDAEKIYDFLQIQGLIKSSSKGRFSISEEASASLLSTLISTDYTFNAVKGPKVLNTLLGCLKKAAEGSSKAELPQEMTFDEFQNKFKALYFEERRQQEIKGVVAIYSYAIIQKFAEENSISLDQLNKYFDLLKVKKLIFTVIEKDNELMEWAE